MTDIEKARLKESFGKLVDACDVDIFNSIRYDVLKLSQLLDEALQAQQPTTQFEAWKQGLTLERAAYILSCQDCPAHEYCSVHMINGCELNFKDWGEQRI